MKKIEDKLSPVNYQIDLKKEYDKALNDIVFEKLVSKLKISDKVLMGYTSSLISSSEQYGDCLKCKGLGECTSDIFGYAFLPFVQGGGLNFKYTACKFMETVTKENKYMKNILLFDEPLELREASFNDIFLDDKSRYEVISFIKDFSKRYPDVKKGLYLHGSFGSGKTYMISALFNELARRNVKSAIVFWPEFLRDLKGSFSTNYNEKFNSIKKVPLLLIDDIGAETTTEWGRDEILGPILQYRMQHKLITFFTSNLSIKDLEAHFSVTRSSANEVKARRIIERIKHIAQVEVLESKNLRN